MSTFLRALLSTVLLIGVSVPVAAQSGASQGTIPDLSGGWLRVDSEGSGSFDGTALQNPPAALTAAGKVDGRPRRWPERDPAGRKSAVRRTRPAIRTS